MASKTLHGFALSISLLVSGCYTNVFGDDYETCEQLDAAIATELSTLQSCSVDADCGQVLKGTSCGCTNDLVARKDINVERFNGLMARGDELGCAKPASDCSCPAADGFVCSKGVCGWKYVP